MQKLYFTPNELAARWGLSCDDVCRLGAGGLIQFGIYVDEAIRLEFGHYEPPDYVFQAKDACIVSPGFFPITDRAVLRIMSLRYIDLEEIADIFPNTACGLVVRVASWMFFGKGDHKGVPLLVAAEEVERYEARRDFVPAVFSATNAPAEQSAAKAKKASQANIVSTLIAECEARATKVGEPFDRWNMPGQKKHFLDLIQRMEPGFKNMKLNSLPRYLKGQCSWSLAAKTNSDATPFYQKLFPEAWGNPGAVSENRNKA